MSGEDKTIKIESRSLLAEGGRGVGLIARSCEECCGGMGVPQNWTVVVLAQTPEFTRTQ